MKLSQRAYRLALHAYPARFRIVREREILSTLAEVQGDRLLPRAGELCALVRGGLGERNRVDLTEGGGWWWRALGSLAIPLTCVNAAVGLAGLWVAWSLPNGPGRWWPAFATLALVLAVTVAARLRVVGAALGLATFAMVAADALIMTQNPPVAAPHLRILEHYPPSGAQVPLSHAVTIPRARVSRPVGVRSLQPERARPLRRRPRPGLRRRDSVAQGRIG